MFKNLLIVGMGGALGSMLRYGISLVASAMAWSPLWGTLCANVLGSMLIGAAMGACSQGSWQLFLTVGVCGGFTTFSTFSSQSLSLLEQGRMGLALLYVVGSIVSCMAAVWLGGRLISNS